MWTSPSSAATWRTRVAALRGDTCSFREKSELSFSLHCPPPSRSLSPLSTPISCSLPSSPASPCGQPVHPPQQTHGPQRPGSVEEELEELPGPFLRAHSPCSHPPSTQPLLPGRLFEETGELDQVSYENRKWLSEGCYHVREGSCVLSLVSGQQR